MNHDILDMPVLLPKFKSGTVDIRAILQELKEGGYLIFDDTMNLRDNEWLLMTCPLHNDTRPSFEINIKSGAWICFSSCGTGNLATLLHELDSTKFSIQAINDLYSKHSILISSDLISKRINDFNGFLVNTKDIDFQHWKLSLWAYYNRSRDAEGVDITLRMFDRLIRLGKLDLAETLVSTTTK